MTYNDIEKLKNLVVNLKDKNFNYIHGLAENTTYHAIVRDKKLLNEGSLLKDIIMGKESPELVEKISTTDPEKALEFFKKYND